MLKDNDTIDDLPEGNNSYEIALGKIMGLVDFERSTRAPKHACFHLERMLLLMKRLGNPHLKTPTIHLAGTKGKGSTAAMVTSVLSTSGYKVGLYTSPHLHSAVERIRLGLQPISRQEFARLVETIWPKVNWVSQNDPYGSVTYFEMMTAMAFLYFSKIGTDFQVIEVGLGGRLDATNVVNPEVCGITSISLDHVETLGDTLELIAYEKAGIFKEGVPVVVAPQSEKVLDVFREVAAQRKVTLVEVSKMIDWRRGEVDLSGQSFEVAGLYDEYNVRIKLLGDHQVENACTAIAIAETLIRKGYHISSDDIVNGLKQVTWPARLEILSRYPKLVVVDGAHNPDSVRRLTQTILSHFEYRQVFLIFGTLYGHDVTGMVAEISKLSPVAITVQSRHPRSMPNDEVKKIFSDQGVLTVFEAKNVGVATRKVLDMASKDDLILGTGSLSIAAEMIQEIRNISPEENPYIKPNSN
jgi:dihydrofolate synthase/folylpolyglutamate synthase